MSDRGSGPAWRRTATAPAAHRAATAAVQAVTLAAVIALLASCAQAPSAAEAGSTPGPNRGVVATSAASPTGGVNTSAHVPAEALVLVGFDGFRHDYLELYDTPTFDRIAERGAMAEGLIPPFPSKTLPSHYTIVTGLYPEHHGIVGNRFWDPVRAAPFEMGDPGAVADGRWYSGEPIWATAELQGMVAASYSWVGSEAEIAGARPTHWYPSTVTTFRARRRSTRCWPG